MMNLQVLETVKTEYIKLRDKYQQKAIKEREKVNDVYVMVCGVVLEYNHRHEMLNKLYL